MLTCVGNFLPGPIIECKGMLSIFDKKGKKGQEKVINGKKKVKIFENLGKNVQNLKTF